MANAWLDNRFSAVMNDTMVSFKIDNGKPVKMGEDKMRELGQWLVMEANRIKMKDNLKNIPEPYRTVIHE